jgi:hypothetical protein
MDIKETKIEQGYSYTIKIEGYNPMMINIEHKLSNQEVEKHVQKIIENGWK